MTWFPGLSADVAAIETAVADTIANGEALASRSLTAMRSEWSAFVSSVHADLSGIEARLSAIMALGQAVAPPAGPVPNAIPGGNPDGTAAPVSDPAPIDPAA